MRRSVVALIVVAGAVACTRQHPAMIVATTNVGNSGLLDAVSQAYERSGGTRIRAHLVGSGRALAMLASREADVAITHAPAAETAFLSDMAATATALNPSGTPGDRFLMDSIVSSSACLSSAFDTNHLLM